MIFYKLTCEYERYSMFDEQEYYEHRYLYFDSLNDAAYLAHDIIGNKDYYEAFNCPTFVGVSEINTSTDLTNFALKIQNNTYDSIDEFCKEEGDEEFLVSYYNVQDKVKNHNSLIQEKYGF